MRILLFENSYFIFLVCFLFLESSLEASCLRHHCAFERMLSKVALSTSVSSSQSVVKMASEKATPSDLYKCVYTYLLENKFTKAAEQFQKQTKVVSVSPGVRDTRQDLLSWACCRGTACNMRQPPPLVVTRVLKRGCSTNCTCAARSCLSRII